VGNVGVVTVETHFMFPSLAIVIHRCYIVIRSWLQNGLDQLSIWLSYVISKI